MIDINRIELSGKAQNILSIVNALLEKDSVSSSEIIDVTGLSTATVSRVLAILKRKKMIVMLGKEPTEKGRKPELFSFNKEYGQLVYIEVMPAHIVGCIADISGEVFDTERVDLLNGSLTLETLLDNIELVFNNLKGRIKYRNHRVMAAGISVPGIVNVKERLVKRIPDVFPFDNISLFDYAEKRLNVPIIINNITQLAVIGQHIECYPHCENLAHVVFMPTIGIGTGIMVNGSVIQGANYLAGEIGGLFFDRDNFSINSNKVVGCLEEYAGLKAIFERINQSLKSGRSKVLEDIMIRENKGEISLELIEKALMENDKDTENIFYDALKVWAIAIINICLLINPDYVIIGGAVTAKNSKTLQILNELVSKALPFKPNIRGNEIGDKDRLIGGMHILKQYAFNQIVAKEAIKN